MTRTLIRLSCIVAMIAASACAHRGDLQRPAAQDNFGVQMARMNLWREALFRFQRAVQINPQDAMAHNNLAVAYEATGDFEKARKEYLEALKLDRSNQYIQKNYSRFVEFLSRNRKRQAKEVRTATTTATPAATGQASVAGSIVPPQPVAAEPVKVEPPATTPPSGLPPPPKPPAPTPPGGAQ